MKKIVFLVIVSILIVHLNNSNDYIKIPDESFRIRIIANSNSTEDQFKKIIIKKELSTMTSDLIKNSSSNKEAADLIKNNVSKIDETIKSTMEKYNFSTNYNINYGKNYFPEKIYRGVKYPGGTYDSVAITIGEGKGNNWWCVLFPPLCNIDENVKNYEYHFIIKDILDKYNN